MEEKHGLFCLTIRILKLSLKKMDLLAALTQLSVITIWAQISSFTTSRGPLCRSTLQILCLEKNLPISLSLYISPPTDHPSIQDIPGFTCIKNKQSREYNMNTRSIYRPVDKQVNLYSYNDFLQSVNLNPKPFSKM